MKNNKSKIIYQIYPLSFNSHQNKMNGDLKGIEDKLSYIAKLGTDLIWLSPVYTSPMIDNGYDVASYKEISTLFGDMSDMDSLIKEAAKKNIGVMMDMVMNHTSDQHEWFKKSIKGVEPFKDYYVWRDKPVEGFGSQFENNAWSYSEERKQWYLHHFAKEQPDLNWENPKILNEFIDILNFWIGKGIKGFRFDVIDMLGKQIDLGKTINIPLAYENIRKLGESTWLKHNLFTVGECWSTNRAQIAKYINKKDGVFTTTFNARYMFAGWNDSRWDVLPIKGKEFISMKEWIFETRNRLEDISNIPNFIENHDFARSVSRLFIKDGFEQDKAKVVCTSFFGFHGPSFIFQGQELGMKNPSFELVDYKDPETKKFLNNNSGEFIKERANVGTRDNARTMIPWKDSNTKYWLKSKMRKNELVTNQEKDINSTLNYYRWFMNFKKDNFKFFNEAKFAPIMKGSKHIFAYKYYNDEKEIIFISNWNFNSEEIDIKYTNIISGNIVEKKIKKYSAVILENIK